MHPKKIVHCIGHIVWTCPSLKIYLNHAEHTSTRYELGPSFPSRVICLQACAYTYTTLPGRDSAT